MSGMHVCVQNTDEEMLPEQMRVFPHCDHDYAARSDGKLFLCSLKETWEWAFCVFKYTWKMLIFPELKLVFLVRVSWYNSFTFTS